MFGWVYLGEVPQCTFRRSGETAAFMKDNGITRMDFPTASGDLAPIENFWSVKKSEVQVRLPRVCGLRKV